MSETVGRDRAEGGKRRVRPQAELRLMVVRGGKGGGVAEGRARAVVTRRYTIIIKF